MQSVSSRIWTRVAVSISYDDNDYTTGISDSVINCIISLHNLYFLFYCVLSIFVLT